MKKIVTLGITMLINIVVNSQNTYDLYNTCSYPATDQNGDDISGYVSPGYTGEYQIFLHDLTPGIGHYWIDNFPNNAITYKVELVSFPFFLNCANCVGSHISPPISTTERKLYMPNTNFPYNPVEKAWVRNITGFPSPPAGTTYQYKLRNEFSGIYGDLSSGNTDPSALTSKGFVNGNPNELVLDNQVFYPHSVLKHTFYMHCDTDPLSPAVDSFSFVLDHTRGRMRYYPFLGSNAPNSNNNVYDIPINPTIEIEGGPSGIYGSSSNLYNTIDYFPYVNSYDNICNHHVPDVIPSSGASQYIRPAPFSLVQTFIGSALGDYAVGYGASHAPLPGLQQKYIIDRPVDLTIINPSEKVIYNPSEVSIDLSLTGPSQALIFPSGYTFKTVSGVYPTQAQVAASDPDNMYLNDLDIPVSTTLNCDDAGPNDGFFANYIVKSGSTLKVESCVNIYDVRILVESGGSLIFENRNSVRGNYYVDPASAGAITDMAAPLSATCRFDCHDKNKYDDRLGNFHITAGQTWSAGPGGIPAGFDTDNDGIIRISGTLTINAGNTLTVNPGVRFEFGENGKLVIDRNAKLQVNGTASNPVIFTSADFCELGMWEGIEVWGNRNQTQGVIASSPQGIAKLNYAKISNARKGLSTSKGSDVNYHGGIIQCQNVEFVNNRVSAEFLSYHNTFASSTYEIKNLSYFKACKFLVTNYLNDKNYRLADGRRQPSLKQISFQDVRTVYIENCLFENSAMQSDGVTPLFETDLRGTAIYSIDAGVFLTGGPKANTFKGFSDAVWALSTGINNSIVAITGNTFENNINSIVLEGTALSRVEQNVISVPAHVYNPFALSPSYTNGYNKPVGVYLIGATDFTVEENVINNYGAASSSGVSSPEYNYGIVVNNSAGVSGDGLGDVYKNIISDGNVSLQAELDNRGGFSTGTFPSDAGLQYKCNEFTNRISYDVTVASSTTTDGKIRPQGFCNNLNPQAQAGNSYVTCSPASDVELKFDAQAVTFNYGQFSYSDQPNKFSLCKFTGRG